MARMQLFKVWRLVALSVLVVSTVSSACFWDMGPMHWATARVQRLAALVAPGSAAAQGGTTQTAPLLPRVAATKPDRSTVGPWQDPHLVVLKFAEGTDIRLQNGAFVSPSGRFATGAVNQTLSAAKATPRRQFAQSEAALAELQRGAERRHGRAQADLNLYFLLRVPDAAQTTGLLNALNAQTIVEQAFARALPSTPTADFSGSQGYTGPAPGGLDSDHAQTEPGGDGSGSGPPNDVRIVDIEYSWRFDHEDLLLPASTLISGFLKPQPLFYNEEDHGTATLGVLVARDNGFGVTGMVPGASVRAASVCRDANCVAYDVAAAIIDATTHLLSEPVGAGVILIEQQAVWVSWFDRTSGFVPVEIDQDTYDAIAAAVGNGIVVVEPAGNGSLDLDTVLDTASNPLFHRSYRDSGAIIVGAGCPPAPPAVGCADRTALPITSYGSRLDVQGWGSDVTTTGYGDLFGTTPTNTYTHTYSGTSSASPMVAAAAAAMQGAFIVDLGSPIDPIMLRSALRIRATAQPAADAALKPIGPRPNLDMVGVDVWEQQIRTIFTAAELSQLRIDFGLRPAFIPLPPLCLGGPCLWVPPANAFLKNDTLYLRYGIPGIDTLEEATLATDKGRLTISGALRRPETDVWRQASYHRFERTMALPAGADASAAKVTFSEGILEVTMPMR